MAKLIYKILLTMDSTGLLLIVYLVKEKIWIEKIRNFSALVYFLIIVILAAVCLLSKKLLSSDVIEGGIKNVEMANDGYLPSYLGYFFVALSIPGKDMQTLLLVFGILFAFIFFSQTVYYNPLFLMFGYKFYYVTKGNNMKVFIISRKEITEVKGLEFNHLKRINGFTFIDEEKE